MTPISILFENSELLLINKESGVSVQGGAGISHPLDKELAAQLGYPVYLVHRLDKDTAGLLLVAKSSSAAAKWSTLISSHRVKKEYLAICLGDIHGKGSLVGTVEAHGRTQQAELHYIIEGNSQISLPDSTNKLSLSLVRVTLGTGRMHQIRIQLAQAGAPIAADDQHGDFKQNKLLRKLGIKKLQLAAVRLCLPIEGADRSFEIPLPAHMQAVVDKYLGSSRQQASQSKTGSIL